MGNTVLTPIQVTRKALKILHQKANFIGSINRQYDDSFAQKGAKIGDTLKIRQPNQYTVRTGAVIQTQDTAEESIELKVQTQKGVDINFSSDELTLDLDDFAERILDPAMAVLAAAIESDAMAMYQDVYNSTWNGASAATYNKLLDTKVLLQRTLTPTDNRTANLDSLSMADIVKDTKTLFQDSKQISTAFKEGYVGRAAGFDFMENTLWPAHTRGDAASYVCNTSTGITSGSATITVSGGSGTFKKGDVITIVGVNSVHPESKVSTGVQQQFVVTADSTTSVTVSPTPITSGAKQNITIVSAGASKNVVAAGTASTAVNTSLLYHKDAFAIAFADLVMPKGVDFSAREVLDGISMRIVRQYDISNDKFPCRIDVMYGYKAIRAAMAARYHNN